MVAVHVMPRFVNFGLQTSEIHVLHYCSSKVIGCKMFYFHSQYGSTVGRPTVAMDTAGRDGRTEIKRAWVRIPVSQEVMGSDGICKYLSCLSLILC